MSSKEKNNHEEAEQEFNPETPEEIESAISECLKKSGFKPPEDLLGLIKLFLLPKRPVDDSKLQLEEIVGIIARIPTCSAARFWNRILITNVWNDIKKPPTLHAGYNFRSADGSSYTGSNLELGKAGSRYAISARVRKPFQDLPDPSTIFDKLMVRDKFKPHPSGISATLFYLGLVITHDLFNTKRDDPTINQSSSYLDLAPLYGSNEENLKTIRLFKHGLLKQDSFADSRILLQPPGVAALVILFSRNHNYIASNLLKINERGRFSLREGYDIKKQDEDLFQTARLINCGAYLKIVLHDYLRAILGLDQAQTSYIIDPTESYNSSWLVPSIPTGIGSQVSLEFNYIYRWHPAISKEDEEWIEKDFFKCELGINNPEDMTVETFRKKVGEWKKKLPHDPSEWSFHGVKRDQNKKLPDGEIARALINGTKYISGSFGARGIPRAFRVIELIGIEGARTAGTCSLNDFRRFLNLMPYKSFEDMNPDMANELKSIYGDVENVELYPGLMTEKTKPARIGSAFGLPFTVSRALLADAINVVRNDRFFTDDYNPYNLTAWGWQEFQSNPTDLAAGGIIHRLLLKHLPGIYKDNSAWALYPFTIPSQTMKNLKNRKDGLVDKVDFEEPKIPQSYKSL